MDAVKEATQRCGVRAERIDEPPSNDRITDRIIASIQKAEFVIVDCKTCGVPMVVLGEHLTNINRECWGRILYRSKKVRN